LQCRGLQNRLQQGSRAGPRGAEQQRENHLQHAAPGEMRAFEGPPARNHEHRRREKCVDQPIAADKQRLAQRRRIAAVQSVLHYHVEAAKDCRTKPSGGHEHPRAQPIAQSHAHNLSRSAEHAQCGDRWRQFRYRSRLRSCGFIQS
jgi:hypothetical protein